MTNYKETFESARSAYVKAILKEIIDKGNDIVELAPKVNLITMINSTMFSNEDDTVQEIFDKTGIGINKLTSTFKEVVIAARCLEISKAHNTDDIDVVQLIYRKKYNHSPDIFDYSFRRELSDVFGVPFKTRAQDCKPLCSEIFHQHFQGRTQNDNNSI